MDAGADAAAGARQAAARQLDDVSLSQVETHAAIAEEYAAEASQLETNVRIVNQVVVDMARITMAQGEQVNNVLSFMEEASQSAASASQELVQSNQNQQRGTRRLLQVVALAVLLVGAIVVAVLLKHG
ncbi:unnamed protein product [Prorocentrum cordatum]|uniref:t-SNARE coiled-coil homology domain-containing protein n=1 Tax=Prorocentrum cordatum TaxID=2364126 RepID=A0ABN9QQ78_9DINO|nr:unnamed protein product [Polarella glacialis]